MLVDTAGGLDDNGGAAVERGELARVRAEQLQKRRRELSAGEPANVRTAREAQDRAELAALRAGDRASDAHQSAAERHRDEADRHDVAAIEQFAAEDAHKQRMR